jgi:hypothetical protein
MVFDQCDQDIERSAAESERLSSFKQQPLRRNQVEWAKRECARRPPLTRPVMVDCLTSGGDPPISPASLESEGAWTVLGVFADAKVVRVQVRDAPIGIIDYGVELDACVVGLLAHIKLLN